jgi:membrane-associated phospholipid phosphatase
MPFAVLIVVALIAGGFTFALARRYPATAAAEAPARAASGKLAEEAAHRPWLSNLLRTRLDPSTATGLALTLALVVAILGGLVLGALAYLMRTDAALVNIDNSVGQWEFDHASPLSTHGLHAVTQLADTYTVIALIAIVSVVEYLRLPNRWIPVFLVTVVVGEIVLVNVIKQALDRVRPAFDPAAASLGPSFPSGHSATAAATYAAVALVLARRRAPVTRALIAAGAVAIAVAVATSRVMLGVHWLSDAIAGLAFGWAWFAVCAVAFGGRLVSFGAPVEAATKAVEQERTSVAVQPRASDPRSTS